MKSGAENGVFAGTIRGFALPFRLIADAPVFPFVAPPRLLRFGGRVACALLAVALGQARVNGARPVLSNSEGVTIYLLSNGLHIDIAMPLRGAGVDWAARRCMPRFWPMRRWRAKAARPCACRLPNIRRWRGAYARFSGWMAKGASCPSPTHTAPAMPFTKCMAATAC